jgi:hypothetical protein
MYDCPESEDGDYPGETAAISHGFNSNIAETKCFLGEGSTHKLGNAAHFLTINSLAPPNGMNDAQSATRSSTATHMML